MPQIKPGELLRAAREKAGLTQSELGKQIGLTSGVLISNWESGMTPSYANAVGLKRVLGIHVTVWGYDPVTCKRNRSRVETKAA